ncbi:MAG: prepilin-type N-terminal cleavage/methylation domain-containing protein [Romboutsia sp.]
MKNNKGFTLLEVIISISIIIFIMFAFFRVYNSSIRVNTKNDRDIKALNLAQSELEDLRSQIKNLDDNTFLTIAGDEIKIVEIPITTDNNDTKPYTKIYIKNYLNGESMKPREYKIQIDISKSYVLEKMYLFDIDISAKLGDEYFSKRNVKLSTSILSNSVESTIDSKK